MDSLQRDLTFAWRRLRATPAFTVFAVVTLALGIGVTTAVCSIVRVVFSPPSGVRDVDAIVNVNHSPGGGFPFIGLSWPDYQDYKSRQTVFEDVTAWRFFRQAFTANGHAETAFGEVVGGEYLQGARRQCRRWPHPAAGRRLGERDAGRGDRLSGLAAAVRRRAGRRRPGDQDERSRVRDRRRGAAGVPRPVQQRVRAERGVGAAGVGAAARQRRHRLQPRPRRSRTSLAPGEGAAQART